MITTEEKAKAYDKALKVIKDNLDALNEIAETGAKIVNIQTIKNCFHRAFPELKENEDEKIKNQILYAIRQLPICEETKDKCIAWLENVDYANKEYWRGYREGKQEILDKYAEIEKQGNQKEINLVEILKHYPKETELYSPLYGKLWLAEVDEKNEIITCYKHLLDKGCTRAILEQEDTISFYSNGTTGLPDFNISKDCMLFLYNIEKQGEQILANSAKTCKDEQKLTENKDYSAPFDIEIPFGAKDSELIQETIRIPDGCYASIEGNEIVIKKGQKSAEWSEEGEMIYQHCKTILHDYGYDNWLKSLKERYIWKPTDLQIEALESATENCAYSEYQDCLRDLIKQLKQLSGNYIQLDPKGE